MHNIKKVAVFPYTKKHISLINNINFFNQQFSINTILSFSGSGLIGKDAGFADNRDYIGTIVEDNFKKAVEENDAIFILPLENDIVKKSSLELIELAAINKKEIICFNNYSENDKNYILSICSKHEATFIEFEDDDDIFSKTLYSQRSAMYVPQIPVVFVGGLIECANQFEVSVLVAKELVNKGLKVSLIGQDKISKIFGFHNYNYYISSDFNNSQKIININKQIQSVIENERPDIIIIEIPEALIKFDNIITNSFGVNMYLFSQAVTPDYLICCSMYGETNSAFWNNLSLYFKNVFGREIGCVHISNKLINYQKSLELETNCYFSLNTHTINNFLSNYNGDGNINLYNLLNKNDLETMTEKMIDEFKQ